jgi:hypothetical protein
VGIDHVQLEPSSDQLQKQLELYLDIYKHHFDIYLKAVALYLAVLGATLAYLFRAETKDADRAILALFIVFLSVGAVAGSLFSRRWVVDVQRIHHGISSHLGYPPFPFTGAIRVVTLITSLCGLVGVAAVAFLVAFRYFH